MSAAHRAPLAVDTPPRAAAHRAPLTLAAATAFLVAGCGALGGGGPEGARASGDTALGAGETGTPTALTVHEWGTYTSVQSSLGVSMDGLHHEDEALPPFVSARDLASPHGKGMEVLPVGVTQKLETPVLYFYGARPARVTVDVRFPAGIVSQWYPPAASFEPPLTAGALAALGGGRMSWEVDLVPDGAVELPPVADDSVWAPSRRVAATPLTAGGQDERFIFYRGVGRFDAPFRVTALGDHALELANDSAEDIPAAFMLWIHEGGGAVVELGPIPAHGHLRAAPTPKERSMERWVEQASTALTAALVDSGLYADEARAMVETWERSYFRTPGQRVLYVTPRAWTDALLPLTVTPTPDALVRTLVGRVEILLPEEERGVVSRVEEAARAGGALDVAALGRFAEPKLRRAAELVTDPAVAAALDGFIREAEAAR